MFIKELNILSFGKFINRKVTFTKGLNIIYGENEAGKSTMHMFIESMFYGFYLKNKKNRIFSKKYYKYLPWNNDIYKGVLKYEYNNWDYRIERNFLKEQEKVNVFREDTGKCMNKKMKYNKNTRLIEPGVNFFGMNHTVYSNTISVGQLGSKTDEELIREVKDKIINLSKSKDQSISVKNVLETLKKKKDEIGTKNRKKSPLGQSVLRLEKLKDEKRDAYKVKEYVYSKIKIIDSLKLKLKLVEENIEQINNNLKNHETILLKNKYFKSKEIIDEIERLNRKIGTERINNHVNHEDYEEAIKIISILKQLRTNYDEVIKEIEELTTEINHIKSSAVYNNSEDSDITRLNAQYQIYKRNIEEIERLEKKINTGFGIDAEYNQEKIDEFIKNYNIALENDSKIRKYEKMIDKNIEKVLTKRLKQEKRKRFLNIFIGILILLGSLASGAIAYYFVVKEFYYGLFGLILPVILFIRSSGNSRLINKLKIEIHNTIEEQDTFKKDMDYFKINNKIMYRNYDCSDIEEYRSKYAEFISKKKLIDEKRKLVQYDQEELLNIKRSNKIIASYINDILQKHQLYNITEENINKVYNLSKEKNYILEEIGIKETLLNDFNKRKNKIENDMEYENSRFKMLLNKNGVISIEEFKNALEVNDKVKEMTKERNNKQVLLNNVLESYTFNELLEKEDIYKEVDDIDTNINKEELLEQLSKYADNEKYLRDQIYKIYGEVEKIEKEHRNLAQIEDEIEFYEEKIKSYEEKNEAIDIAHNKIVELSNSIHNSFVPTLNNSISKNFSHITGGKYQEIKIDEKMNVTIIEPHNEQMITIDSLSGGTIDQIYFALRLSLSDLMSSNSGVPFILDDSFAQYDWNRLNKSIEMIYRESSKRQILLFTCQNREIDAANQLGIKYNYIEL